MSNASSSSARDELYKNWIKGGLGLKYVKNGLTKYVVDTVNTQHTDILKTVPRVKCTSCKLETLQPAHTCILTKGAPKLCPLGMKKCLCLKKNQIPCPNNFCGAIHDEIVKSHRYLDPNWSNTDISKWSSEPWELAKCYINISGYVDKTTAEETDCSGILSVICNNFTFPSSLEKIVSQVKSTRNEIMHAPNLEVDSTVLKQYLTNMEDLLASIPPGHPEVTSAITDIQMLNKTAFITPKDEKEMRIDAFKEFQIEKDRIIQELQNKEKEMCDLKDQSIREITDEMEAAKANMKSEKGDSIKTLHTEMNVTKDLAIKEIDKSKLDYIDEIESTASKVLTKIHSSKEESLQSITQKTQQTTDSLTELHVKHKDVEIKLGDLEQSVFMEQKNVKILYERTGVIEEKQKLMEASISILESKDTDSPEAEISTMKKDLKNLDQKMDALVSSADGEGLRRELCEYYQKQFSNISVTPGISCPIGQVGDLLFEITEIETEVDEESGNMQIWDTDDEPYSLFEPVTDETDVLENSHKSIFYRENQQLKRVLLIGKSKKGKTAWCLNLMQKWVNICLKMQKIEVGSNRAVEGECGEEADEGESGEEADGSESGEEADRSESGEEAGGSESGEEADRSESGEEADRSESGEEADGSESGEEANGSQSGEEAGGSESGEEAYGSESGEEAGGSESGEEADRSESGEDLSKDEMFLCKFDIVIYLPLKDVSDLQNCKTIADLMKNCSHFPFYQDVEKLDKLQHLLKLNYDRCLILLDDIHLLREVLHVPNMSEFENCLFVSTSLLLDDEIIESEPDQFDRFVRIQFANAFEIQSRFVKQFANMLNSKVTEIENHEKIALFFETEGYLSGIPVLQTYMISYWFQSGCIENTLATNYAAMLDFIICLAEDDHTGNTVEIESLSHSVQQLSNHAVALPVCIEKFSHLKKYTCLVSRYGNSIFNHLFELEDMHISKNEEELLNTLGIIIHLFEDEETKSFKSLSYSLDMFLAALYICMEADEIRQDALFAHCIKYFSEYTKVKDREEFIFFLFDIDPKLGSRLSEVLYKKITIFEEKDFLFGFDPIGNFASFSGGISTVERPIYTEKISLVNDLALSMWKRNADHVYHVSLNIDTITETDLQYLKSSKTVASVKWHVPDANLEEYDLKLVSDVFNLVQSLTVLIIHGGDSCWIPYCTETQDIDLSKCRAIQHLDIENISCRKIAVNSDSLMSISVRRIKKCAITVLHTGNAVDEIQVGNGLENSQCKLRHIRVEYLENCKLDILSGPKHICSVVLLGCSSSNLLIRFPSDGTGKTSKTSDASLSGMSKYINQNVEMTKCRFTKLIYFSETNQREPLNCQTQYKKYVSIEGLLYQQNIQSGVCSNMGLKVIQLTLRYISDDFDKKPSPTKKDENTPDINENVDVHNLTEVNIKTLLLSLKHMQGLHHLKCENIDSRCWEYLGLVLPDLQELSELSITNDRDIPVVAIKSMKGLHHLTKLVIDGSWQGSVTKQGVANKRQLAHKELCRILPELGMIDTIDIFNLHHWPKLSLPCLNKLSCLNSLWIQMKTDDEIETACSILQSLQRLASLSVECLTREDVTEVILCLQYIKDLGDLSCSGIAFSECFPEEPDSLDLSKLRSFKIDCLESSKDIPNIIVYVPNMVLLQELTIHAFLSDESWTLLASSLPAFHNLHTTDFTSSLHCLFPITVLQSLGKNASIRKVTLTFPYLSENWSEYCKCLSHLNEIDSLNLIFSTIEDMYVELSPLKSLVQLKEFSLIVRGFVKPNSCIDLEEVLLHLRDLEVLEVSDPIRSSYVVKAIKCLENLHSLYLPGFKEKEWIELGQILPNLSKLKLLRMEYRHPKVTEDIISLTGRSTSRSYNQTCSPILFHSS